MSDKNKLLLNPKEFEKRFEEEIRELIIVINSSANGAVVLGEYLQPSAEFIASVDTKTGEVSHEKGHLEWLIKNEPNRIGFGQDFKQFEIYRVKVRKNIPVKLEPYMSSVMNNCYMLLEVLEREISDDRLNDVKEELSKTVEIDEEGIGTFELDRDMSAFEGYIDWLGSECGVWLETDVEDGNTANQALNNLKELFKDIENWDKRVRTYAAQNLTELANQWLQDSDEEPITEESFASRIEISEIVVSPNGNLTLHYYDDDMFWGHIITIDANIDGKIEDAGIAG